MALALNSRRITLIVAVVAAALAGILTIRYLSGIQRSPDSPTVVAQRFVIVAGRTIRAHEKIVPAMLVRTSRPESAVDRGALAETREAVGSIALIAIPEGDTLTHAKIGVPAALGVTAKLQNGMRAISIPVDFIKSVSSLVAPGDRVDVLATSTRGHAHPTRTVIRGALVLAVNTSLEPPDAAPSPGPGAPVAPVSVTLGVTPEQANVLTYADINTTLRLALRPPKEPIRAFPVQAVDAGGDEAPPAPVYHANDVAPYIPPPVNPAPAPAANVPAPALPVAAPAAVPAPAKAILVIEGDTVVAGQH
ncbi:MAG: hypothetical protein NVSMB19_19160 [Vulcanimicrobiaceae bacterium]